MKTKLPNYVYFHFIYVSFLIPSFFIFFFKLILLFIQKKKTKQQKKNESLEIKSIIMLRYIQIKFYVQCSSIELRMSFIDLIVIY